MTLEKLSGNRLVQSNYHLLNQYFTQRTINSFGSKSILCVIIDYALLLPTYPLSLRRN